MSTVTQRISQVNQPRGGYLNPSLFLETKLEDSTTLFLDENISPALVGIVVDYLSRAAYSKNVNSSFAIPLMGAQIAEGCGLCDAVSESRHYLQKIKGLDIMSIYNACKLAGFDVWGRNPIAAIYATRPKRISPNRSTIENIKTMVMRSLSFFDKYGPVTADGFTFEGGYTDIVNCGDGDFLTKNALWDMKVSKKEPTSAHTLQILMYYIMGKHSQQDIYKNINTIGIFNPRLNLAHTLKAENIDPNIIRAVEKNVIGY